MSLMNHLLLVILKRSLLEPSLSVDLMSPRLTLVDTGAGAFLLSTWLSVSEWGVFPESLWSGRAARSILLICWDGWERS